MLYLFYEQMKFILEVGQVSEWLVLLFTYGDHVIARVNG